ncbi:thioredoxin-like protein [Xylariales sp. AK1849]|nr:thioredoxin-like protein [Xylariales sp. AK1849]
MTTQAEQLSLVEAKSKTVISEQNRKLITDSLSHFKSTFVPKDTVQIGDKFPQFYLSDATGNMVSGQDLIAFGPLLITFYRGEWCPYCNIAIAFLQKHFEDFKAKGVTLVAISPELPNKNMTTTEKHQLKFPVLTDLHNEIAKQLGIVYDQSSARSFHAEKGVDLKARNGDDTWEVPIPATLLVDRNGTVRNAWINPDYTKRMDPQVALGWIDALDK